MARNGVKSGGKDWVKGQSGNPKGGIGLPKDVKDARKLTAIEFTRLASEFLYATKDVLQNKLKDPAATMLELMIAGIIAKATSEQDYLRASFLLDRILGKPKQNEEQPQIKPVIITTRDGTKIECGMKQTEDE
jgi:hypothetical protein